MVYRITSVAWKRREGGVVRPRHPAVLWISPMARRFMAIAFSGAMKRPPP
jgi:hypothetical protein